MVQLRIKILLLALSVIGLTVGCGGHRAAVKEEVDGLKREIRDLSESHKALGQRYENLQDRLALVEDRAEAQALQRRVRPPLPVVRVVPPTPVSKESSLPPATITQDDLDRLNGYRVAQRRPRRSVTPPANAAAAGNVGVRAVARQIPIGGPRVRNNDPLAAFKRAKGLHDGGNLTEAIRAFDAFVGRWPRHGYADNALYLLGKSRFQRAEFRAALALFRRVLSEHPSGNQVPDALLMTGLTLARLGRSHQARDTLARLKAMYPDTGAAKRAAEALTTFDRLR